MATNRLCESCGGLAFITFYRPFSGGPKYYCEKHKLEPDEVMPKNIDNPSLWFGICFGIYPESALDGKILIDGEVV